MKGIYVYAGGNIFGVTHTTSYTADANEGTQFTDTPLYGKEIFVQLRYDATADTLNRYFSFDCEAWQLQHSTTGVTADPVSAGVFVRDFTAGTDSRGRWGWFRIRTDANRNECAD